ncbi:uncharacterized protein LOC126846243 [Adelges cooleyi]|uniref:uncharacterized protein LOC126846243 n=1 Tax=Adelges cooleyi TaxID=133065 RepID=UPI00217FD872|nr:uncharacterized protein LOC126846243 [Adelges cooleyi]
MKINVLCLLSALLVSSINVVSGHQCLVLQPMEGFEMKYFFASWYALKTTMPFTRCVVYDVFRKNTTILMNNINYQNYIGFLEANPKLPSQMTFAEPTKDYSNPEFTKSSFVVLNTDYVTYATVFMCIKKQYGTGFKHFVSILSRTDALDSELLNSLVLNIISLNIGKLNHVDQKDCNYWTLVEDGYDTNVFDNEEDGPPYVSIKWLEEPAPQLAPQPAPQQDV